MTTSAVLWDRVCSRGRLVYWHRKLGENEWLAVMRVEGGWRWRWYGPKRSRVPNPPYLVNAEGIATTSRVAKTAADKHIEARRSTDTPQSEARA